MTRTKLLNKLINLEDSVDKLINKLGKAKWDYTENPMLLKKQHVLYVLQSYLEDKINVSDVEGWATIIESNEDIAKETPFKSLINDIIYELANPYLTEALTKERAKALCTKLA